MSKKITCFWFRRDLRLQDNAGLYHALQQNDPVQPIFIFDTEILDKLPDSKDARIEFILQEIQRLNEALSEHGSGLIVRIGKPLEIWQELAKEFSIGAVYANRDYEPYAQERDKEIYHFFEKKGVPFIGKKDQVIFEKNEICKSDGNPYTVFTPYSKVWKRTLEASQLKAFPSESETNWAKGSGYYIPTLEEVGFEKSGVPIPGRDFQKSIIKSYHDTRNFPGQRGTTRLGIHLRFGTISIRRLAASALKLNETYLNELIWREFYMMILWNFPHVVTDNFRAKYDRVEWRNNPDEFKLWCVGKTGYPIVDAGMRELNATGYMHNRVRMIVASFLTKHLLIDWRLGEKYFADKLLDFELASNNGGWQWAAGTGCDAAPYFRVFNPTTQMQKFDPQLIYVKKWVPEYGTQDYPPPMVEHKFARERALQVYKSALSGA